MSVREAAISSNIVWLKLNYLEKLSWVHYLVIYLFKQNPNIQKTSTQSATHFAFQGGADDWTMNEQSPLVVDAIQFVGQR